MTAIAHCLRTWRHYLIGSPFVVKTDNVATSYFQTQRKLSPKQARWQDFLAEFDFTLKYKPGTTNVVADALNRRAELASICQPESNILQRIREGMDHDPQAKSLMEHAKKGKTRRFWHHNGLLLTKGNRVYVPHHGNLRKEILKESHDSRWVGHQGVWRTLALVGEHYYWPHLLEDAEAYVKTCLVCQQDKTENKPSAGLLEPFPVPEGP